MECSNFLNLVILSCLKEVTAKWFSNKRPSSEKEMEGALIWRLMRRNAEAQV